MAVGMPGNGNRQDRGKNSRRRVTAGQGSARRSSPTAPDPELASVLARLQDSDVVPNRKWQRSAPDRPRCRGCPDSSALHIPCTEVNRVRLFWSSLVSPQSHRSASQIACKSPALSCSETRVCLTLKPTLRKRSIKLRLGAADQTANTPPGRSAS